MKTENGARPRGGQMAAGDKGSGAPGAVWGGAGRLSGILLAEVRVTCACHGSNRACHHRRDSRRFRFLGAAAASPGPSARWMQLCHLCGLDLPVHPRCDARSMRPLPWFCACSSGPAARPCPARPHCHRKEKAAARPAGLCGLPACPTAIGDSRRVLSSHHHLRSRLDPDAEMSAQ